MITMGFTSIRLGRAGLDAAGAGRVGVRMVMIILFTTMVMIMVVIVVSRGGGSVGESWASS